MKATIYTYTVGFVASIALTLAAYALVTTHVLPMSLVLASIIALGIIQLVVQLLFFLHVGQKGRGWNTAALSFAILIVVLFVGGTLWIMANLQSNNDLQTMFPGGTVAPEMQMD